MQIFFSFQKSGAGLFFFISLVALTQIGFAQTKEMSGQITGQINWTLPLKQCWVLNDRVESVASDNDYELYLSLYDGNLRKISAVNSQKIWEIDLGNKISSDIILGSEKLFVSVNSTKKDSEEFNTLSVLSKKTGLINSRTNVDKGDTFLLKGLTDKILLREFSKGRLILYQREQNKLIWSKAFSNQIETFPETTKDHIVLATADHFLELISLQTGQTVFRQKNVAQISRISMGEAGKIFVGDVLGNVFQLNLKRLELKKILRAGGKISHLISSRGQLLITSFDNFVYLVSEKNGKLLWKKRLPGRIIKKPLIRDPVTFVFPNISGRGFILDLGNGKIINRIETSSDNFIVGDPLLQGNSLYIPLTKGLYKFSSDDCL